MPFVHIHNHRVIVSDIRPDNILLDDDFSVKMIDFSESLVMPLDWNMKMATAGQFSCDRWRMVRS